MWQLNTPVHPCPFCGSTQILALHIDGTMGLLQCGTCHAQGPIGATEALAVAGWQTRGRPVPQPCLHCGVVFQPRTQHHHYHSAQCQAKAAALVRKHALAAAEYERREVARVLDQHRRRVERKREQLQRSWEGAST